MDSETGETSIERLIRSLPHVLSDPDGLALERANSLKSLLEAKDSPRFFACSPESGPVEMIVDQHLTLLADAFVCDPVLGSLGIVHILRPTSYKDSRGIDQLLNEAILLRHALLEEARSQSKDVRTFFPYSVEAVFMLPPDDVELAATLGACLQSLLRSSSVINAIGVNVWSADSEAQLGLPAARRRAFPWLMREVKGWLSSSNAGHTSRWRLDRLDLTDFRRNGHLSLELPAERNLHLVLGTNGSGKTSIAEGIEFLLTGRVERLPSDRSLMQTLTFHGKPRAVATVEASVTRLPNTDGDLPIDSKIEKWERRADTPDKPSTFPKLGKAGTFRLHQALADALLPMGPKRAAEEILQNYFPEETAKLREVKSARAALQDAFSGMPPLLASALSNQQRLPDPDIILSKLSWLDAPKISPESLYEWLLLSKPQVEALRPVLSGGFADAFTKTGEQDVAGLTTFARSLDADYLKLVGEVETLIALAKRTREVLKSLGNFVVQRQAASKVPATGQINRWLEAVALCDIAEREDALLSVLEAASAEISRLPADEVPWLAAQVSSSMVASPARRAVILESLRTQRDMARRSLPASGLGQSDSGQTQEPETITRLAADVGHLDLAANAGLFGASFRESRGAGIARAVNEAMSRHRVMEVKAGSARILIGEQGWTEQLLEGLDHVENTLLKFAQDVKLHESCPAPSAMLDMLRKIHERAKAMGRVQQSLVDTLRFVLATDGQLFRAVNELLALFTPARWAYSDLTAKTDFESQVDEIHVQVRENEARLILNTAEQNAFALAMFLLCAQRQNNPLRLLVLDDPLQNMDEFTVVAVARGVTRLLRLMKNLPNGSEDWNLLLLLHDADDVDRFRTETPCSISLLPWLSPSGGTGEGIQLEDLAESFGLQSLGTLISST